MSSVFRIIVDFKRHKTPTNIRNVILNMQINLVTPTKCQVYYVHFDYKAVMPFFFIMICSHNCVTAECLEFPRIATTLINQNDDSRIFITNAGVKLKVTTLHIYVRII